MGGGLSRSAEVPVEPAVEVEEVPMVWALQAFLQQGKLDGETVVCGKEKVRGAHPVFVAWDWT